MTETAHSDPGKNQDATEKGNSAAASSEKAEEREREMEESGYGARTAGGKPNPITEPRES